MLKDPFIHPSRKISVLNKYFGQPLAPFIVDHSEFKMILKELRKSGEVGSRIASNLWRKLCLSIKSPWTGEGRHIRIKIRGSGVPGVHLKVRNDIPIQRLEKKIGSRFGIPPSEQVLELYGDEMEPQRRLIHYGVIDGAEVIVRRLNLI